MHTSPHDSDDAFQAIWRAERWRAVATASAAAATAAPKGANDGEFSTARAPWMRAPFRRRSRPAGPSLG